ncbi:MAG TPA: helix-turn-helix transcriptional regulator [Ilumatobacter sp.]|nr:helix-turn-helix transcriptional regulator [Ilumatobacter sp.]
MAITNPPTDLPTGTELRELRTQLGISQKQVSTAMAVSQNDISRLERGIITTPPSPAEAETPTPTRDTQGCRIYHACIGGRGHQHSAGDCCCIGLTGGECGLGVLWSVAVVYSPK